MVCRKLQTLVCIHLGKKKKIELVYSGIETETEAGMSCDDYSDYDNMLVVRDREDGVGKKRKRDEGGEDGDDEEVQPFFLSSPPFLLQSNSSSQQHSREYVCECMHGCVEEMNIEWESEL